MPQPTNLIDSWLHVATAGDKHPKSEALAQLNRDLGTKYRPNRLYEWRAGTYPVPPHVQAYMLHAALSWIIQEEGGRVPEGDAEFTDRVLQRMLPPPRAK
ncbi:hypothetical protein FIU88_18190 (plasmid) [Halomonas sp. THAF12]|uniref:hypothetical protein n=1 Tax=Halomonas sp. THAF12 TaxID=2587849 RepID=UPI001268F583|nr:hypothetical protein [Halomonas sp. THAF12]QFT86881.1 hypothetical protein FIU88_18190 [Halomonas sp. THAF12]